MKPDLELVADFAGNFVLVVAESVVDFVDSLDPVEQVVDNFDSFVRVAAEHFDFVDNLVFALAHKVVVVVGYPLLVS